MNIEDLKKTLWATANKLRGGISPSDYKHVVLGLIFLKYVSDAFDKQHAKAIAENYDPEDRDYYIGDNVFWVPEEARWQHLVDNAKQPTIGVIVDNAMEAIEHDNPTLKGVLPKDYARESLDKQRLGELIDLFTNKLTFNTDNSADILGQVYEYFMGMFADSEGKHGGEFYTPRSIVKLLVEMLQPYSGRVYDPCCGSGGMFVWSEKFVTEHQGRGDGISIYGQEYNETTWRLAKMNMAIRGIDAKIHRGDTLRNDQLPDLRFDYILANPPFNMSDWGINQLDKDIRWKYGVPPRNNANFAWVQHMIYHLSSNGSAGFVLANGSMSSSTGSEGNIRKGIIDDNLVDCIVTLPAKLFFNVTIPCCLWFISKDRTNRAGKTLFIDARELGHMVSRKSCELSNEDIQKVANAYIMFKETGDVEAEQGFCKVATTEEIAHQDYVLTPGRYVGVKQAANDGEPFEQKFPRLKAELYAQFEKSHELEEQIKKNLEEIE